MLFASKCTRSALGRLGNGGVVNKKVFKKTTHNQINSCKYKIMFLQKKKKSFGTKYKRGGHANSPISSSVCVQMAYAVTELGRNNNIVATALYMWGE